MILYSEYRLIEKETETSIAWKGAHLLCFFLAFLFGLFCTFCFHMISYMFDEQCVLFPKLLTLNKERNSMLFSFLPLEGNPAEWPVDFITTQWVEKNVCVLPMYVPLVSGIFGLVWTTMFVMCSSSMSQHGLQRPWRLVVPLFVFSIVMSSVCVYTAIVTQTGLQELCVKLGQATGSTGCSYTINVISLAYNRRIRGVYQATWLIVISSWLHTICWILSALVAMLRVALAVDFKLICVTATLEGNYDKLLQENESQVRLTDPDFSPTVFPDSDNFISSGDDQEEKPINSHFIFEASEAEVFSASPTPSNLVLETLKSDQKVQESLEPLESVDTQNYDYKKVRSFNDIDVAPSSSNRQFAGTTRRRAVSERILSIRDANSVQSIRPAKSNLKDKTSQKDEFSHKILTIKEPRLTIKDQDRDTEDEKDVEKSGQGKHGNKNNQDKDDSNKDEDKNKKRD